MHIAILGATSQIAGDFVSHVGGEYDVELSLFARRPLTVAGRLVYEPITCKTHIGTFSDFGREKKPYDAIINFVGSGSPAQTAMMAGSILDITYEFDSLALNYLQKHPECRYIFLSSGAAYGGGFSTPADENTASAFQLNKLLPSDWYGAAKMFAECRHRALPELAIIDIRVFNYFSRTQDMSARYLITDMVRAIRDKTVLQTSSDYIVRDFLHPADFYRLIRALLNAPRDNAAIDCFSRAPIDKPSLLAAMQQEFGLRYEIPDAFKGINATGNKTNYYSENFRASEFGYEPSLTSLEGVLMETTAILGRG